ncbi:Hypothetical protein CAP_3079 [Chondromyces apiculatus DSM 436]|uniref:Uncharacterized protein n=2 Tax=Chondromyces apiculatus TaxID=51 RepID=A0A017TAB4_9BACT|nr:Hypothetical protein CAP_3079 [Chondromyces apiculatus DSM 436]
MNQASAWREHVLSQMQERFHEVSDHMRETFGLSLPRHVAVAAAFFQAGDDHEQKALARLGRRPGLVLRWFEEGGLARKIKPGLNERLQDRYRRDPPEFVTALLGNAEGLHYGLWYDDPAQLPSTVARIQSFGSGEVSGGQHRTLLSVLRADVEQGLRDAWETGRSDFLDRARKYLPLLDTLRWFEPHDDAAVAQDKLPAFTPRPDINGGLGPLIPRSAGDAQSHPSERESRWQALQSGKSEALISEARRATVSGKSAFPLVLGRELLFLDDEALRPVALQLLKSAYEGLRRKALAEIAQVVLTHRDQETVSVYE